MINPRFSKLSRQTGIYRRIKMPFIYCVSLCVRYTSIFSSSVHPISIFISESLFIRSTIHMTASIFLSPLPTQTSISAPSIEAVFQVSIVNPVYEIRKSGMGRSFRPVNHDFGSVHQLIQCFPEIFIVIIHFISSANPDCCS